MTRHNTNPHWENVKIDRKELSELLLSAGISISHLPIDLFPLKNKKHQELFFLAEILTDLTFYTLSENDNGQSNKKSSDLL